MTQRTLSMILLAIFALTAGAVAHEGDRHMAMGTVEIVDAQYITLTLKGDESETFTLTEETSFVRSKQEVARQETAVGERAVVMYQTEDDAKVAIEVRLPPRKG